MPYAIFSLESSSFANSKCIEVQTGLKYRKKTIDSNELSRLIRQKATEKLMLGLHSNKITFFVLKKVKVIVFLLFSRRFNYY